MRFRNKIVLVTGAGQNTGLGIAARFAAEGARVFLNDKTAAGVGRALATLRRRGFRKLAALPGDIGVPADVEAMFRQLSATAKRLDVLVNNAAHLGVGPEFLDTKFEFFEAVVRVNLLGTFHVSQQAARLMKRHGGGAIVNLGSNVSTRAIHKRCAYLASKGGIDALTLAMAVDLAPYRIRVNTVAPGYIHSDRWATLPAAHVRRRRANVPLGREATADDIAQAVLFLASDQAANITGTRLVVDGGCSAQHMPRDIDV
jgi:NAD(P)-dependent dehydrogenase (short-subunit alcohol dehydrogenase family)